MEESELGVPFLITPWLSLIEKFSVGRSLGDR